MDLTEVVDGIGNQLIKKFQELNDRLNRLEGLLVSETKTYLIQYEWNSLDQGTPILPIRTICRQFPNNKPYQECYDLIDEELFKMYPNERYVHSIIFMLKVT